MRNQKRRVQFNSPVMRKRLSLGLIVAGAVIAAIGGTIRAAAINGSRADSGSHLFDIAGWLVVLVAAGIEATSSTFFFDFAPRSARRRAIMLASIGVFAALLGCYLASWVFDDELPALLAGAANGVLVGGIGAGLAGLLSLAWHFGGNYAARRIEKMGDDGW